MLPYNIGCAFPLLMTCLVKNFTYVIYIDFVNKVGNSYRSKLKKLK
jgi:hypothetical protein